MNYQSIDTYPMKKYSKKLNLNAITTLIIILLGFIGFAQVEIKTGSKETHPAQCIGNDHLVPRLHTLSKISSSCFLHRRSRN